MANSKLRKKIGIGRHASSIKRARQTLKRRMRNKAIVTAMRTDIKKTRQTPGTEQLQKTVSAVAKAAGKGLLHRNRARRLISRLARATNRAAA